MAPPNNDPYAAIAKPVDPYAAIAKSTLPGNPTETMRPQTTMEQLTNIKPITSKMPLSESIPTFVGDIGAAGINTLAHPLDTIKGIASSVMNPAATLKGMYDGLNTRPAETVAQGIGQAGAMAPVAELAPKIAAPVLTKVGDAAQNAGTGLMNKVAGSLKADFKRGANPGKSYLEAGGGPALSMQSLANKGADLKASVGAKTGAIRQAATDAGKTIPVSKALDVLNPPIAKAVSLEMGSGGMNNVAPIQRYAESFTPALSDAKNAGGFTPNSLFELKQGIAQNTNWSDPSQFSLKSVRQQQVGGIGGLLSDELPELKPLNSQYQGLKKFADRAQLRADTHSSPLTSLVFKTGATALGAGAGLLDGHPLIGAALGAAADSVPVKTALASGLYHGGRGLSAVPNLVPVPRLYAPTVAIPAYNLNAKNKNDGQ